MNQRHGEMREVYPVAGEYYRYGTEGQEGRLTFQLFPLDDAASEQEGSLPSAITLSIESHESGEGICRDESGRIHPFAWAWVGAELHLWLDGGLYVFQRPDPAAGPRRRGSGTGTAEASGDILAPMPGAVLEVLVAEGDAVERNQTVMVMESMKMELVITAPRDGVVRRVSVQPGQQVERGMRLLELALVESEEPIGPEE